MERVTLLRGPRFRLLFECRLRLVAGETFVGSQGQVVAVSTRGRFRLRLVWTKVEGPTVGHGRVGSEVGTSRRVHALTGTNFLLGP